MIIRELNCDSDGVQNGLKFRFPSVYSRIALKPLQDIWQFLCALVKHWAALLTGGAIIAFNTAYHAEKQTQQGKTEFNILAFLFFVIAAFLAWRDQRKIVRVNTAAHSEQLQALKSQVETLQAQLDDKMRRQKIKTALGDWHTTVQNLRSELDSVNLLQFNGETRQKFAADVIRLEEALSSFLEKNIGKAEAAIFTKDPDYPVETPTKWDDGLKMGREVKNKMLYRLQYRMEKLEMVITKLDSKDFVLPVS